MYAAVYLIQSHLFPSKKYVGSAVKCRIRWSQHVRALISEKHANEHLQRHVAKYGIDDLRFSILQVCWPEQLIELEQYYIDILKPSFNMCKVAGSRLGVKNSDSSKLKMRKRAKQFHKNRKRNFRNNRFL